MNCKRTLFIFSVLLSASTFAQAASQIITTDAEKKKANTLIVQNYRCGYIAKYSDSEKLNINTFFNAAKKQRQLLNEFYFKIYKKKTSLESDEAHKESFRQGLAKEIQIQLNNKTPIAHYFVPKVESCLKVKISNMLFFDGLGKKELTNTELMRLFSKQ